MLSGFIEALKDKQKRQGWGQDLDIYNFDIIFAFLQFINIDDEKARELAQNCVHTMSFQGIIDYLSHFIQLERGVA